MRDVNVHLLKFIGSIFHLESSILKIENAE